MRLILWIGLGLGLGLAPDGTTGLQDATPAAPPAAIATRGLRLPPPTLPELCAQWREDRRAFDRLYSYPLSEARWTALEKLHSDWEKQWLAIDFAALPRTQQIDWLLLRRAGQKARADLAQERQEAETLGEYLPFASDLIPLLEARSQRELAVPRESAEALHRALETLKAWQAEWKQPAQSDEAPERPSASDMRSAARLNGQLRRALDGWYSFGAEYDPTFTFWCQEPWKALEAALRKHEDFLEREVAGIDPDDEELLLGQPIGRERLLQELQYERIPYSPEELIAIADKEFAWCDEQRVQAAHAMGLEGDWRAAQTKVRTLHVEPGEQPRMIRELAEEAVQFLESRDLVTIPAGAKETWRMQMMSPERQRFSPYFTGGEVISIAFPTAGMGHEAKMQSMMGNNRHFSRATVHHELIPGHHLQGYMARRWNPHRSDFRTAFFVEGWALYWELRLWDLDFAQSPEDEIGMLFWRSHRCARILFSLNYHLGLWSPEECVDFLVERVGHLRRNATAEVRRSIQGGYGPLYQVAYMIGGLQLHALYEELVVEKNWTQKAFHDAVLRQGSIPVDLVRAALIDEPLHPEWPNTWRFAD